MTKIEERIDIRVPIDVVFSAITDPRRTSEWNPNIIEVRNLSNGPAGQGSTWQQVMLVMGRPVEVNCAIVQFQPPNLGVLQISGPQNGQIVTRCEQLSGFTRVTQIVEFEAPKGMGKLASAVVGPAIRREVARTMARQREVLESEAGGDSGSGSC